MKKGEREMRTEKRSVTVAFIILQALILVFGYACGSFAAEDPAKFPSKPIKLIIPYAPGGTSDLVGRKLAELASKAIGQPIVSENKAGGAGVIGSTATAKAEPDGYTLVVTSCSPNIYVPLQRSVPYEQEDFTYIIQVADFSFIFAVRADSKYKTFKDFVEEARKNPGKLKYQSQGPKSAGHVQMAYIFNAEKVKVNHIPGEGVSEVIRQLLGGHVDAGITAGLGPQIKAGGFRGLAVAGPRRNELFPDVPTFYELGYSHGIPFGCHVGILGPKNMPPAVVKKLHDAFKKAVEDPSYKDLLKTMYEIHAYRDTKAYTESAMKDYKKVADEMKDLGLAK
jgi:tripartite-type tricarboxylate transporter receptor subunit TctC